MSETAAALVPERPTLASLRSAAAGCQACALWEGTTQTVFGEGPASAILRARGNGRSDEEARAEARTDLVEDLTAVARLLGDG